MEKRKVQDLTEDYVTSYNEFTKTGLNSMIKNLRPAEFQLDTGEHIRVKIENLIIRNPRCNVSPGGSRYLFPWECRRMKINYEGQVMANLSLSIDNKINIPISASMGCLPIMVRSNLCNLSKLKDPKDYVKHNEEDDELGGYFIMKGNQCMIRYLVQPRRNFPLVRFKPYQSLGSERTGHEVFLRSVRDDDVTAEMKILWQRHGCPDLQLQINKRYFQIPLPIILKALTNRSNFELFADVPKSASDMSLIEVLSKLFNRFLANNEQFKTDLSCLGFLGHRFREYLRVPNWVSNEDAGRRLIDDFVAIHVKDYQDKYNVLMLMLLKLQSFVSGGCAEESMDTLNFQELLTPGSLYQQVLRMSLQTYLSNLPRFVAVFLNKRNNKGIEEIIKTSLRDSKGILRPVNLLLTTGSIGSNIIPGLKQTTGLRILTDNINFYRLAANFRGFHRGAFFTTMKSSAIRRLLPESFGFVCPVHTPDGTPCGLLNHFSVNTKVQTFYISELQERNLENLLKLYIMNFETLKNRTDVDNCICVMLDGRLLGYISNHMASQLADFIRYKKLFPGDEEIVPKTTEIVMKNWSETGAQYPGLYIFTTPGRMIRPVYNIMFKQPVVEYIGTFEQTYLDISCRGGSVENDGDMDSYVTHQELSPESMYSFTAGFTPFQNFNPSPRNLYQCQMSKQSMGFTYYTTRYRSDNKLFCFLDPQIPLVRSKTYDEYEMQKRPLGYNPIVAVCSYTGYDMEDAMVINRSSLERGMGRCCIYKHYVVDLSSERDKSNDIYLGCGTKQIDGLDSDGLPPIGARLEPKTSPVYAYWNSQTQNVTTIKYKESEVGYVVNISLNGSTQCATICIKIDRNTDIGDKFSSRHGQKGVNSLKLPMEDMPFTDDGIVPDQLFNPHSFPTRMTMGMELEFMAGKLAALSAKTIDCTAFQKNDIVNDYCTQLQFDHHYNGYGYENLRNGATGRKIDSDVSFGIIYYQRLRHLVADKYQVRTIGKIDSTTRQPVKGRKVGGGIRFGEMERDGLLSHGAVFCLQDRFIDCNSDKATLYYCVNCGSFMHTYYSPIRERASWMSHNTEAQNKTSNSWKCKLCEKSSNEGNVMVKLRVPAVTRHLFHELSVMNVRIMLTISSVNNL